MRKPTSDGACGTDQRGSLYEEITVRIIADLERGTVPWVQPWGSGAAPLGLPRNAVTAKTYSGINVLILWGRLFEAGYASQNWLTYRQARSLGGSVRQGEKGVAVCYADTFIPKAEQKRADQDGGEPEKIPFLRRYTVFNVAQCDGLPAHCLGPCLGPSEPRLECQIVPEAEALAKATLADIRIGGARAFYQPDVDVIQIPPQPAFFDQINYYRTLFHELGHWTGHKSRLTRDLSGGLGSKAYAREELIAEIATAFVCASLSIVPTVRHADYLGGWLKLLREDNRAIFRAASQASKAADTILAFRKSPVSGEPEPMGGEAVQ
jgi:antirestriction protein ArdC